MTDNSVATGDPTLRAMLEASANSPLAEADPKSLDILMDRVETIFNQPPLDHTDSDIAAAVLYFRTQRAKFATLAAQRADGAKKTRTKSSSIAEALTREQARAIADSVEL